MSTWPRRQAHRGTRAAVPARRRPLRPGIRRGLRLLPIASLFVLTGCTLQPISQQAGGVRTLYNITFAFAAVIFVVVAGLIVGFALRYRQSPKERATDHELPPQIHGNSTIEIVWTAIPTVIVLVLFVLSAMELGRLDTAPAQTPVRIVVDGFQWQWKFEYLGFKSGNGNPLAVEGTSGQTKVLPILYLPLGQPVHFHLVSEDVIHSFFIPNFLFKRDVIPGHPNDFYMTPSKLGTYPGKCAELCGLFHSRMLFTVKIVTPSQFVAWGKVAAAKQTIVENRCRAAANGVIPLSAQNEKFDTACMQTAAGQPFKIDFDNKDSGIDHNVAIFTNASMATTLFRGNLVKGAATVSYSVPPLPAGTYYFHCDVHPGMNGVFRVK